MYKRSFYNITDNNIVQIKIFWNFIRPFFVSKGTLSICKIMRKNKTKLLMAPKEVVQVLNYRFVNIVERSCGKKPSSIGKQKHLTDDIAIIDHVNSLL